MPKNFEVHSALLYFIINSTTAWCKYSEGNTLENILTVIHTMTKLKYVIHRTLLNMVWVHLSVIACHSQPGLMNKKGMLFSKASLHHSFPKTSPLFVFQNTNIKIYVTCQLPVHQFLDSNLGQL